MASASLALNAGGILQYDLGAANTSQYAATTSDLLTVGSVSGGTSWAGTVNINPLSGFSTGNSTYTIISPASASSPWASAPGVANLQVTNASITGVTAALASSTTGVTLTTGRPSSYPAAGTMTWNAVFYDTGQGKNEPTGGTWNTPADWTYSGDGSTGHVPLWQDNAVFNFDPNSGSVGYYDTIGMSLSAPMAVNSLTVNGYGFFSLSGSSLYVASPVTISSAVGLSGGSLVAPSVTVNGYHGAGSGYANWGGFINGSTSITGNVILNGAGLGTSGTITGNVTALPNSDGGTTYSSYLGGNGDSSTMTITGNVTATHTVFNPGGDLYDFAGGHDRWGAGNFVGTINIGGSLTADSASVFQFGVHTPAPTARSMWAGRLHSPPPAPR